MSVHRAGSYYGVPHSTLEYKVKERVGVKEADVSGPPTAETSKVETIVNCASG
jgi:hypothetical protein